MVARIIKQKIGQHLDREECNDSTMRKVLSDFEV